MLFNAIDFCYNRHMSSVPNLRHLQAVAEAVRRRNLGRAAQAVHLSQPATTQAIRKLEAGLGTQLFERTSAGLNPTEAGRRLALRIERAFDWLNAGRRLLGDDLPPLESTATGVQLRAITAVAEYGGYSLAARELGVSQPSVHRAVRDFQSLCGRALFRATPQGLELIPPAREVARCFSLALAEIEQGAEDVRESLGIVNGRVWIGCLPLARTGLLPDALTRLLERFPDVKVRIFDGAYGELLHALRHGRIDLIVGALRLPVPTADIEQEALFSDPLSIVVRTGHPMLAGPPPSAERFATLDWIVPREGTPARDKFHAFFGMRGLSPPEHVVECSSLNVIRGMLLRSDRAGLLSAAQVRYEVETGQLGVLPMPLSGTERPIGLTVRKNWQPTVAMSSLMTLLREAVVFGNRPPSTG